MLIDKFGLWWIDKEADDFIHISNEDFSKDEAEEIFPQIREIRQDQVVIALGREFYSGYVKVKLIKEKSPFYVHLSSSGAVTLPLQKVRTSKPEEIEGFYEFRSSL